MTETSKAHYTSGVVLLMHTLLQLLRHGLIIGSYSGFELLTYLKCLLFARVPLRKNIGNVFCLFSLFYGVLSKQSASYCWDAGI